MGSRGEPLMDLSEPGSPVVASASLHSQDAEELLFGSAVAPPLLETAAPPPPRGKLSELLGKAHIAVRKKGNKKWKREVGEDMDMIWLESRKESILLDVPKGRFGQLEVYATHESSQRLSVHAKATKMLQEQLQEVGDSDELITRSLKNNRDKNQFVLSASQSNGQHAVLCVIVSVKDGQVAAVSPVLAIYRDTKKIKDPEPQVRKAFQVLLEEARRSPESVIMPEVTAASLQQCWRDLCEGCDSAEVREHPCYEDLQLVMKKRQNGVWSGGHENGKLWVDRGLWDAGKDRKAQLDKMEEAVTPTAEERANDEPQTVYCLPYLDVKHGTIMWFCWTQCKAAKDYFLPLRRRPPTNPNRNTWVVTTFNLLENEKRPPMLFKLPAEKAAKESVPSK